MPRKQRPTRSANGYRVTVSWDERHGRPDDAGKVPVMSFALKAKIIECAEGEILAVLKRTIASTLKDKPAAFNIQSTGVPVSYQITDDDDPDTIVTSAMDASRTSIEYAFGPTDNRLPDDVQSDPD